MNGVTLILLVLAGYMAIGAVFAGVFVARGVAMVDHAAAGSGWAFRLLIAPGVAALWPLMLSRWVLAARTGVHEPVVAREGAAMSRLRRAHAAVWMVLGPVLIGAVAAAWWLRPPAGIEAAANESAAGARP